MKYCMTLLSLVCLLLYTGCDYPYQPEVQQQPSQEVETGEFSLYPINVQQQICNPSISQNDQYFPGSLLWLNLGTINVTIPAWAQGEFSTSGVAPHDRLVATDTSNTITWFMMKPDFVEGSDMQDPEWSTHPDFIAYLGQVTSKEADGFIVRVSNKESLKFNDGHIKDNATPHLWVAPSVATGAPNRTSSSQLTNATFSAHDDTTGMADSTSVASFFGTDSVTIVFVKETSQGMTLFFMDYTRASQGLIQMPRPSGKNDWQCESPLISPDGLWIVYHMISPSFKECEVYLQRLEPGSKPIFVAENAADPHWWKNPLSGAVSIMYCSIWGAIRDAYESIENINAADIGKTYVLSVDLASMNENLPAVLNFSREPVMLVNLPFRGGLSPSGLFLGTGYQYGYIYKF